MSDMYVPMPVYIPSEPDLCPKCEKPENVIRVCKHCGYEYPVEKGYWYDLPLMIFIIIVCMIAATWILFTIFTWLLDDAGLSDILKGQWDWISNKKIW